MWNRVCTEGIYDRRGWNGNDVVALSSQQTGSPWSFISVAVAVVRFGLFGLKLIHCSYCRCVASVVVCEWRRQPTCDCARQDQFGPVGPGGRRIVKQHRNDSGFYDGVLP